MIRNTGDSDNLLNIANVLTEKLALLIDNDKNELEICTKIAGSQATAHTAIYLEARYGSEENVDSVMWDHTFTKGQKGIIYFMLKDLMDYVDWQELAEHYQRKSGVYTCDCCKGQWQKDDYVVRDICIDCRETAEAIG